MVFVVRVWSCIRQPWPLPVGNVPESWNHGPFQYVDHPLKVLGFPRPEEVWQEVSGKPTFWWWRLSQQHLDSGNQGGLQTDRWCCKSINGEHFYVGKDHQFLVGARWGQHLWTQPPGTPSNRTKKGGGSVVPSKKVWFGKQSCISGICSLPCICKLKLVSRGTWAGDWQLCQARMDLVMSALDFLHPGPSLSVKGRPSAAALQVGPNWTDHGFMWDDFPVKRLWPLWINIGGRCRYNEWLMVVNTGWS